MSDNLLNFNLIIFILDSSLDQFNYGLNHTDPDSLIQYHNAFEHGYDDIPDYFYTNMKVLNFAQPNNVRSLDQYLVDIELKREQERIDQLIRQHRHKALVDARNWLL